MRDKHVDCPGPAHPHQLCHRVQEGEAGVRQVVDQQHLEIDKIILQVQHCNLIKIVK